MKRRILSAALTFVLLLTMLPAAALASGLRGPRVPVEDADLQSEQITAAPLEQPASPDAPSDPNASETREGAITHFEYRNNGATINPNKFGNPRGIMWITYRSSFSLPSDCTFTLKGPEGSGYESGKELTPYKGDALNPGENAGDGEYRTTGTTGRQVFWHLENPVSGEYTITIQDNNSDQTETAALTLVKLTFDPNGSEFTATGLSFEKEQDNQIVLYGTAGAELWYELPQVKDKEPAADETNHNTQFIGWSEKDNTAAYNDIVQNTPESDVTLYAAFGVRRVTSYAITLDPDSEELAEKVQYVDPISTTHHDYQYLKNLDFGYTKEEAEAMTLTFEVQNTGNQDIEGVYIRSGSHYFDTALSQDGSAGKSFDLPADKSQKITLTVTPKMGITPGTYYDYIWLDCAQHIALRYVRLILTVEAAELKITAENVEKYYGQTVSPSDVAFSVAGDTTGAIKESLGTVTFGSDGFHADAAAGISYPIQAASSNQNYKLSWQGDAPTVEVKTAAPAANTLHATSVKQGGTLADSNLTGTFCNPSLSTMSVSGTLSWEKPDTTVDISSGTIAANWVFTPDDTENYHAVTGSIDVEVDGKEPTSIELCTSSTTFVYDGKPHGLSFTANRSGAINVTYRPQAGTDEEWTSSAPTAVGTYEVKAQIAPSGVYSGDTYSAALTITPRPIKYSYSVGQKIYDGTVNAGNLTVDITNKLPGEEVFVSAAGIFDKPDAGSRNVAITLNGLTGKDAANYSLPADTVVHTTSIIAKAPITLRPRGDLINEKGNLTKEYGAVAALTIDMFEAESGLVPGEDLSNVLSAQISCIGTAAGLTPGQVHAVTATITSGNYTLKSPVIGYLEVIKATPILLMDSVSAGSGRNGNPLSTVSLTGACVNPNNSWSVLGKFTWVTPGETLPDTGDVCSAQWKYTLTDTVNYNEPENTTGTVSIALVDKTPIGITFNANTLRATYDGSPHPVTATPSLTGCAMDVMYREHLEDVENPWTASAPVNAGTYDVKVIAYADASTEYADNEVAATMSISKATPNTFGVTASPVLENTPLAQVQLTNPTGVDGKSVEGSFSWDSPNAVVSSNGQIYNWTFVPTDPNYASVQGSTTVALKPDTRQVSAAVYNLPNNMGYHDIAVIDIAASQLRVGDQVAFYLDAPCTEAASAPATVSQDSGIMTVSLDGDALSPSGGNIYAKITGKTTTATAISYPVELGFSLSTSQVTLYSGGESVKITATPNGSYQFQNITWSLNSDHSVSVSGENASATLTGKAAGSAALTASATFVRPDTTSGDTITLTQSVAVTVFDKIPAEFSIDDASLNAVYDGNMHPVKVTTGSIGGSVSIEYRRQDDPTASWSYSAPINVGSYDVRVTVSPGDSAAYAANVKIATLTITKAKPDISSVTAHPVPAGATLSQVVMTAPTGVKGESLAGTFVWEESGSTTVVNGTAYNWTFHPTSGNYDTVSGSTVLSQKEQIKITLSNTSPVTYDGKAHPVTAVTEPAATVIIEYQEENDTVWTKDAPIDAGTYMVRASATIGDGLHSDNTVNAQLLIMQAAPDTESVSTRPVVKGTTLSQVELSLPTGVDGKALQGKFLWADGGTTEVEDGHTYRWTFQPEDSRNYTDAAGSITISVKQPVKITITSKETVPYDAAPHAVTVFTEPANAQTTILYMPQGGEEATDAAPIDAGVYQVKITAAASDDAHVDGTAETVLTIEQVTPTASGVSASAVKQGSKLSDSTLSGTVTGVNGVTVDGRFTWDDGSVAVVYDTAYRWTFTPDSANYTAISGSAVVPVRDDARQLSATVYNLPGDTDYAVIDAEKSQLLAGDRITFYSDPACANAITGETVFESGSFLTVTLNPEALDTAGGAVYAKITGSSAITTVSYPAEPDFTLSSAALSLFVGSSKTVTVTPAEGYTIRDITWTPDSRLVTVKGDESSATITAVSAGKATVTVIAAFVHPDTRQTGEINITKTITVTVSAFVPTPGPGTNPGPGASPNPGATNPGTTPGGGEQASGPSADVFVDVNPGQWYYDAVSYVLSHGLMVGTSTTTFSPDIPTTRGMIVTILYRIDGSPSIENSSAFADVSPNAYYANAVRWASGHGIVKGYDDSHFGPEDAITREQLATILFRYASYKGYDVTARADLSGFADAGSVSPYSLDAMRWANACELVRGVSGTELNPAGAATRAQVASILMRFCENIAK